MHTSQSFNLEKVLLGHVVVTKNGKRATFHSILSDDVSGTLPCPLTMLIDGHMESFTLAGKYLGLVDNPGDMDLIMEDPIRWNIKSPSNHIHPGHPALKR